MSINMLSKKKQISGCMKVKLNGDKCLPPPNHKT